LKKKIITALQKRRTHTHTHRHRKRDFSSEDEGQKKVAQSLWSCRAGQRWVGWSEGEEHNTTDKRRKRENLGKEEKYKKYGNGEKELKRNGKQREANYCVFCCGGVRKANMRVFCRRDTHT
jgi:hypothetical protein